MRRKPLLVTLVATSLAFSAVSDAAPAHAATPTVPAAFSITGSGNGHGVGLSQWGAQGMALEGFTFRDILSHYYVGTSVTATDQLSAANRSDLIRVGIVRDAAAIALRGESLGGAGGQLDVSVGDITRTVPAGVVVSVTLYNGIAHVTLPDLSTLDGSHVVVRWNGTAANGENPGVVNVSAGASAAAAAAGLGSLCANFFSGATVSGSCNHRYRYGHLDINSGKFGDSVRNLNVVLTQRLDDEYIEGIGEVPSSWAAEALRAQAVAARSYALASVLAVDASATSVVVDGFPRKVRSSCLCQVVDDTSDQNYVGFAKEYATQGSRWVSAVRETSPGGHGLVVTYGSTVVKAFFAASTGGRSQAVRDVWGSTSMPWLASVDDHWSLQAPNPDAAWVDSITQATLVSQLNSALASAYSRAVSGGLTCTKLQFGDVSTIQVLARYGSGAVKQIGIADSGGNSAVIYVKAARGCANVSSDRLRSLLGVKSTYLTGFAPSAQALPGSTAVTVKPLRRVSVTGAPTTLVNPGDTTIMGAVSPAQYAATVSLQELVGGSWSTLATTTTSLRGTWSLAWPRPSIGGHKLRVVARNAIGSRRSAVLPVSVVGEVSMSLQRRAARNTVVRVQGSTVPAVAGAKIIIERRSTAGWRRIASATTLPDGTWSADVAAPRLRGTYRLRARTRDERLGTVSSRLRRLAVY